MASTTAASAAKVAATKPPVLKSMTDSLPIWSNASTTSPLFTRVQTGIGRLVATADVPSSLSSAAAATTRLTTLSHQAPFRWIPLRSSAVARAGAAIVYGSNYGGGLLPGDALYTHVHVQAHARVGLLTQGSNRVYKQSHPHSPSSSATSSTTTHHRRPSRLQARYCVDADGLLVVAPDPQTPFAHSVLHQTQRVQLHRNASLCWMDWMAAGRLTQGERWAATECTSQTQFIWQTNQENDCDYNHYHDDHDSSSSSGASAKPFLVDSVHWNAPRNGDHMNGMDWSTFSCNAYATMVLYGNQVQDVVRTCHSLQSILTEPWTRVRESDSGIPPTEGGIEGSMTMPMPTTMTTHPFPTAFTIDELPQYLAGPVWMGITTFPAGDPSHSSSQNDDNDDDSSNVTVIRFAATGNEDLYRVFYTCLKPLQPKFGHAFFQERIRAAYSAAVPSVASNTGNPKRDSSSLLQQNEGTKISQPPSRVSTPESPALAVSPTTFSPKALWAAHLLTDSSLPTGGFAHSAGIEAAAQLQVVQTVDDIDRFARATVQSTLRLVTPTLCQVNEAVQNDCLNEAWTDIHANLQALLVGNGPACAASLDQGTSLLRLARQWPDTQYQVKTLPPSSLQAHYAAVFGLVTATWGLSLKESRHLLAYCVARDVVSAAVRLNLIGPLASVPLLAAIHTAVDDSEESLRQPAATCAPVLETLQPLHDVLAVRLFRT